MVDFNMLNSKLQNVQAKRVDRDYLDEGRHVVKIVGVETRETQQGKELVVIECDTLSSSNPKHEGGSGVKQLFALSNEPAWRIDQNLALIRAMINAACPGTQIDAAFLGACLTGGNQSALAGRTLMIIAKRKISKNDKAYLDFSYKAAKEDDVVAIQPQPQATVTPTVTPTVTANSVESVESEEEDEPAFDI
jgi:hypothetical protein